jgi:uncharacterized DUF497 family protein
VIHRAAGITWDPDKERKRREERGIELREIAELIANGKYMAILESPSRPSQSIFLVWYHQYTHVVPFVIAEDVTIVLKTASPSRRFHQIYGENHETEP